ncbi:hypothetical protein CC1G_01114 [Coprinopsis cinerea okayama7|uniref:Ig-like domain-containing protein n=1 Tax=Coprinopsis cinerea (strain Okayama-7 / 130 / ATCC MYA-4618 / FGSC 9003) TaxID=240176 RepID=A8NEK0_COPC7|nr:hypothetical protein CC1G_01114 [Coprinopsis cinerea okayama7\|eukprot:XP_001833052.2 hypothetical protein CC1G_01114 [Coprinopsis cinerea okayama7\
MPIPSTTPLRHKRAVSPSTVTPIRTPSSRSTSHYSTYTPTITSAGTATRLNIVTRVALEGKAKHGDDGASIKMYLKLAVPLDSVTPGTTVPLFPEENVKILSSQVHPLDNNSRPYNFLSTVSPLLHRAAKALNLPARTSETFTSAFGIPQSQATASSSRISKPESNSEMISPVDEQHSGHILVSGYSISYVLPKVFPTQSHEYQDEVYSRPRSRRLSISERNTAQFMAAIDMWVPYVSRPPRSPYLLSIPTPRCLHNHIKLRIFPPNPASNFFVSLSSIDDEVGSWDLTADPHVTRSSSGRIARSHSYNNFADDESSDSSTAGFSEGCGIQGTFPSAERIRIRWAKPQKSLNVGEGGRDGRRRVGVKSVKGEMTCVVRGRARPTELRQPEGILMDVEYKGTCTGVWFPGVATLLGMDVGLEAKGSEISWAEGHPTQWTVSGGNGYTGFDAGYSTTDPVQPASRTSSFESNSSRGQLGGEDLTGSNGFLNPPSRSSSTSSSSSLLRAPLPTTNVAEYSFEGSSSSLGSNPASPGALSSIPSLSVSVPDMLPSSPPPPGLPITLHLNINDLLPPAKNVFTFTISGTIVVTPKTPLSRLNGTVNGSDSEKPDPTMLPKFTILAADSEATTTVLHHQVEAPNAVIEVYRPTGDIYRDAQAKKTVLRHGGSTKCGEDGGRIVLRIHDPFKQDNGSVVVPSESVPSQPLGHIHRHSRTSSVASTQDTSEPLEIPLVLANVCPLAKTGSSQPSCYGVTLRLPIPISTSEWLEFGFLSDREKKSTVTNDQKIKISVVSATVEGIPVKFETNNSTKAETECADFEFMVGREWLSWVKVDAELNQGGELVLEYLVEPTDKGKSVVSNGTLDVLLPTFPVPIRKFEVDVVSGCKFTISSTNLEREVVCAGETRLVHYYLKEFFCPRLGLKRKAEPWKSDLKWFIITWLLLGVVILRTSKLDHLNSHIWESKKDPSLDLSVHTSTVTITTTLYPSPSPVEVPPAEDTQTPTTAAETLTPSPSLSRVAEEAPIDSPDEGPSSVIPPHTQPTLTLKSENPHSSPTPVIPTSNSLQGFQLYFQFPWLNRDSAELDKVVDVMKRGFGTLWRYLRVAYHYPLPPP